MSDYTSVTDVTDCTHVADVTDCTGVADMTKGRNGDKLIKLKLTYFHHKYVRYFWKGNTSVLAIAFNWVSGLFQSVHFSIFCLNITCSNYMDHREYLQDVNACFFKISYSNETYIFAIHRANTMQEFIWSLRDKIWGVCFIGVSCYWVHCLNYLRSVQVQVPASSVVAFSRPCSENH